VAASPAARCATPEAQRAASYTIPRDTTPEAPRAASYTTQWGTTRVPLPSS